MQEDRRLIGLYLRERVDGMGSISEFTRQNPTISRAVAYRVFDGSPDVTWSILRRFEYALGLPMGTLAYVAAHDWEGLRDAGVREDEITWLMRAKG